MGGCVAFVSSLYKFWSGGAYDVMCNGGCDSEFDENLMEFDEIRSLPRIGIWYGRKSSYRTWKGGVDCV